MDEEKLNMEIRKFLKKVGITSQREIEGAVRAGVASGKLKGTESLSATVRLRLANTDLDITIDGKLDLA